MANIEDQIEDQKEDLLQAVEDVLKRLSESGRRTLAKEIICDAAFWGTKNQIPIDSLEEAMGIIHEALTEAYGHFKTKGEFEQLFLS